MIFKALNDLAPIYLCSMVEYYVPTPTLRSTGLGLLKENKAKLVTKRDCAFVVRAPKLWNSLLEQLRLTTSLISLKSASLSP